MDKRSCAFSGHRNLPKNRLSEIAFLLRQEIIRQIEAGVCDFYCGGALGFDTLAALTILDLMPLYPHIRLILALPCKNQDRGWSTRDKERYRYIKERAHKTIILHEQYVYGCMQERNRYLVDHAQCLIAYLTQLRGGTYYTFNYAKDEDVSVVNIASLLE